MGSESSRSRAFNEQEDPCRTLLQTYVRCTERHAGKAPDVYEEYCEEEKSL